MCEIEDHIFDSTCEDCIERSKNIDPILKKKLKQIGDKYWIKGKFPWITGEEKDYWENNSDPDSLGPMQDLEYEEDREKDENE